MSQYFEKYGGKNPVTEKNADPVQCCLEGYYLNCPENPYRFGKDVCHKFMGQRCARGWDKYCDLYLDQETNADFTGKKASDFLFEAFTSKFCRDDTSDPNNKCYTRCEMMNPLASNSAVVCQSYGNNAYRNIKTLENISTRFLQDGNLDSTSPISVHACPKTCDILSLNDFDEDDRVLNEVLDRGVATNGLMNLAQNVIKNKIPVKNTRFRNFIEKYISTTGQPNQVSALLGSTNFLSSKAVPTPMDSTIPESKDINENDYVQRDANKLPINLSHAQTLKEGFKGDDKKMSREEFIVYGIIAASFLYFCFSCMCKKN